MKHGAVNALEPLTTEGSAARRTLLLQPLVMVSAVKSEDFFVSRCIVSCGTRARNKSLLLGSRRRKRARRPRAAGMRHSSFPSFRGGRASRKPDEIRLAIECAHSRARVSTVFPSYVIRVIDLFAQVGCIPRAMSHVAGTPFDTTYIPHIDTVLTERKITIPVAFDLRAILR